MLIMDGLMHLYLIIIMILKSLDFKLGTSYGSSINFIEYYINMKPSYAHLIT